MKLPSLLGHATIETLGHDKQRKELTVGRITWQNVTLVAPAEPVTSQSPRSHDRRVPGDKDLRSPDPMA